MSQFSVLLARSSPRFPQISKAFMSSLIGLNTKCLKKGDPEPAPLAPGKVRVYNMRFCPWAERVILYLAVKNIEAEVINIDLAEKPEWYFKKHPEGKVPSLEVDGEITIESGLIPEYLDDRYSEKRVLPTDAFSKFQQKLLSDQLSSIAPSFYGLVQASKDPSLQEEKNAAVKVAFAKAEGLLKDAYFGGSSVGFADLLVFPFFERHYWFAANGRGPLEAASFPGNDYPKLTKWFSNIYAHPEIKNAVQPFEVAKEFILDYARGKMNYDAGL